MKQETTLQKQNQSKRLTDSQSGKRVFIQEELRKRKWKKRN